MAKPSYSPTAKKRSPLLVPGIILGSLIVIAAAAVLIITLIHRGAALPSPVLTAGSVRFSGEGVQFDYPAGWKPIDMRQRPICQVSGVKCLLSLGSPLDDGVNFNVLRYSLTPGADLAAVDQSAWDLFIAYTKDVQLLSTQTIEIGGMPAIQRMYSVPSEMSSAGRAFVQQTYIANGEFLFETVYWAPSQSFLDAHLPDVTAMLTSLRFIR